MKRDIFERKRYMAKGTNEESKPPIDVVITWVDGNDPTLAEKRNRYLTQQYESAKSSTQPTRFASVNEITYCLLSIFRFAPFVRKIFIVTDNQQPSIYEAITTYFPERKETIKIVDHKEIFQGFEDYLPTFNSRSIENMLWRIKGLSDCFVYFNDDTFLVRAIKPEDWFIEGKPVLRGRLMIAPIFRYSWNRLKTLLCKYLLLKNHYEPRASFHLGQWNSARLLGFRSRYFVHAHSPHAMNKQAFVNFFNERKATLEKNISFKFRHYSQITFIALSNHLQLLAGNTQIAAPDLVYMQPYKRSKNYIDRKIGLCEENAKVKFLCVQSLDLCSAEEQNKIFDWLLLLMNLQKVNPKI